jgi:hypothetical protein
MNYRLSNRHLVRADLLNGGNANRARVDRFLPAGSLKARP